MITLLMALFMVLLSISSVNISKYQVLQRVAAEGVHRASVLDGGKSVQQGEPHPDPGRPGRAPRASRSDSSIQIIVPQPDRQGRTRSRRPSRRGREGRRSTSSRTSRRSSRRSSRTPSAHGFSRADPDVDRPARARDPAAHRQGAVRQRPGRAQGDRRAAARRGRRSCSRTTRFTNPIRVEGNTDNVPISGGEFPSNWELSTARADRRARVPLHHGVPPSRLSVAGYADQQPIAPNDTADGRALNRRVERGRRSATLLPSRRSHTVMKNKLKIILPVLLLVLVGAGGGLQVHARPGARPRRPPPPKVDGRRCFALAPEFSSTSTAATTAR